MTTPTRSHTERNWAGLTEGWKTTMEIGMEKWMEIKKKEIRSKERDSVCLTHIMEFESETKKELRLCTLANHIAWSDGSDIMENVSKHVGDMKSWV